MPQGETHEGCQRARKLKAAATPNKIKPRGWPQPDASGAHALNRGRPGGSGHECWGELTRLDFIWRRDGLKLSGGLALTTALTRVISLTVRALPLGQSKAVLPKNRHSLPFFKSNRAAPATDTRKRQNVGKPLRTQPETPGWNPAPASPRIKPVKRQPRPEPEKEQKPKCDKASSPQQPVPDPRQKAN
jgi:hypothetical protein